MVARINSGKSIRGVLNYNENKVKEGTAQCIDAVGFGCEPGDLSFKNKLSRFMHLTTRNKIARTNAIHISLNFAPTEKLSTETLRKIASSYMEKIGFGDQPYLVYQHEDAAHPHIHIVTTNIQEDGKRIDIHYIGKNKSDTARKEIEEAFNLIKAEGQEEQKAIGLKPADLQQALYGKSQTKAAISNIVRTVAKHYRFANFKEFSDILRQFNVLADRGQPGTRMHEKGGLVYQLSDQKGNPVGVPIKSSSIYEKPTLKKIEGKYEDNRIKRLVYKQRLSRTIDLTLQSATDQSGFEKAMKQEGVLVEFRKNDTGYIYGITYIDNTTGCFFNGSDLGKAYSAKQILERLQTGMPTSNVFNQEFVTTMLEQTDFSKGFRQVLTDWTQSGLLVKAADQEDGSTRYKLGHARTDFESYLPANSKMTGYFRANGYREYQATTFIDQVLRQLLPAETEESSGSGLQTLAAIAATEITSILNELFAQTYADNYVPPELLRETRKKKRKRSY